MDEFRVLIVGGGPAGLSFANMLAQFGIDFLLLERYPAVVTDIGANITLLPHSVRIFDAMGLLEHCEGQYVNLGNKVNMGLDGTVKRETPFFKCMEENHGYPCMAFSRSRLCKILYEALGPENQPKIRMNKEVQDIEVDGRGVHVRLADGTTETGSLLVGADGVHSATRTIMRGKAQGKGPEAVKDTKHEPGASPEPITTFEALYGTVMPPPADLDIPDGVFFETHGTDKCTQLIKWKRAIHFGLFRRVRPSPTRERRTRYTDEEVKEFKAAYAGIHVTPTVTAGQLFSCHSDDSDAIWPESSGRKPKLWTRLVQQPEGFAERWRYGTRIALLGNSAIQVTSTAGLGYNVAMQSCVFLANKLGAAVSMPSGNSLPDSSPIVSEATLERVLIEYEKVSRAESKIVQVISARMIRGNTWDGWTAWFMAEWFLPWVVGDRVLARTLGKKIIAKGRSLDCGRGKEKVGLIPWVN